MHDIRFPISRSAYEISTLGLTRDIRCFTRSSRRVERGERSGKGHFTVYSSSGLGIFTRTAKVETMYSDTGKLSTKET